MNMNSIIGKKVLALVRNGDYAHPGEEDAIDMVFKDIEKNPNNLLLDVGCGIGGTAYYLEQKGMGKVTGIDIEQENIKYAQEKHLGIDFIRCDAAEIDQCIKKKFDILYLLTSFYAFSKKEEALLSMSNVAKSGAKLLIFDYAVTKNQKSEIKGLEDSLILEEIENSLEKANWTNCNINDISDYFEKAYKNLVSMIKIKEREIVSLAGKEMFIYALSIYEKIYNAYSDKKLKGVIISATRK